MSALRRLVCRLIGHAPPEGITRALSIRYCCARCSEVVSGELLSKLIAELEDYRAGERRIAILATRHGLSFETIRHLIKKEQGS